MRAYELVQKPAFLEDFVLLEKAVQKKALNALKQISANPFGQHSKKLKKYENVYRWRIGDHRLCYSVGTDCVSLLAIGPRSEIYSRFKLDGDTPSGVDFASARIVPTVPDDPIPARLPEGKDQARGDDDVAPARDRSELLRELLRLRDIPEEYHKQILRCATPDELLSLNIPQQYISSIIHIQSPPPVEEIAAQASLVLEKPEDLEKWAEGTLTGFLLRLDPEQEKAAAKALKGPALVKGGPGTGKSLVALYRIRNMFTPEAQDQLFGGSKPRVLFVTFTNSLTTASQQLLRGLIPEGDLDRVDVMTLDSLASRYARSLPTDRVSRVRDTVVIARSIVKFGGNEDEQHKAHVAVARLTAEYLADEFEWVIDGRGITSLEEYLDAPRPGRGTPLDLKARKAVWELYRQWRALLKNRRQATFGQYQLSALEAARNLPSDKKYDCVVLDEAQDLKPVGIRFALQMCKSPEGFYMTADDAQSIYGRGFSWRAVSEELRVQGRTVTLRRNYRSTAEIQAATDDFLHVSGLTDGDRQLESVRRGPKPLAIESGNDSVVVARQLKTACSEAGLPLSMCAVLVRSHDVGSNYPGKLKKEGIHAQFFESKEIDLSAPCVKVMTIHAAKGLEFPIVAVVGLKNGLFPPRREAHDEKEALEMDQQERRLFHVAISRAMRRLFVVYSNTDPSDFIADLDGKLWEWTKG